MRFTVLRTGVVEYFVPITAAGGASGSGLVEADGYWWGRVAKELALDGRTVRARELAAVLGGVDPTTGEVLRPRHHRLRNLALDATFAPPKSVSLLGLLGTEEQRRAVADGHRAAVAAALAELEREAAYVRSSTRGAVVRAHGLAAAAFTHRVSRAEDPHLHTHALVMNLGRRGDGRWLALDSRQLFVLRRCASALYDASLRASLAERLGCAFRPRGAHFELEGVGDRAIVAFSRRELELGYLAEAPHRGGARVSRPRAIGRPIDELEAEWHRRLRALGITAAQLGRCSGRAPSRPSGPEALVRAAERLLEDRAAGLNRFELLGGLARSLPNGARPGELDAAVREVLDRRVSVRRGEASRVAGDGRPPRVAVTVRYLGVGAAADRARVGAMLAAAPVRSVARTAGGRGLSRLDRPTPGDAGVFVDAHRLGALAIAAGRGVEVRVATEALAAVVAVFTGLPTCTFEAPVRRPDSLVVFLTSSSVSMSARALESVLGSGRSSAVVLPRDPGETRLPDWGDRRADEPPPGPLELLARARHAVSTHRLEGRAPVLVCHRAAVRYLPRSLRVDVEIVHRLGPARLARRPLVVLGHLASFAGPGAPRCEVSEELYVPSLVPERSRPERAHVLAR